MKRNQFWFITAVLSFLVLTSCSGLPNNGGGGGGLNNAAKLTITMISQGQTQSGKLTILAWQAVIASLSLNQPGGNSTSLPIPQSPPLAVDLNRISTDTLLLGTFSVPAATTFTTLTMGLSKFIITIHNESGGNIGNCPDQAICEFTPPDATVTIVATNLIVSAGKTANIFFTLLPMNVVTASTAGLSLTFAGANTAISEQSGIRAGLPANTVDTIEDFAGVVTAISGTSITVTSGVAISPATNGVSVTAALGTQTFDNDDSSGQCGAGGTLANCVKVGSIVSLDADVDTKGAVTATEVDLLDSSSVDAIEGTIFPTLSGFDVVVTDKQVSSNNTTLAAANVGDIFVVNLSSATFSVDTKTLSTVTAPPIPTNLFSAGDLRGGQAVRLHVTAATGTASAGNQTLTADRIQLRWSRVTALSNTPNGSIIDVSNVGSIFQVQTPGTAIVQTYSPGTTLDNVSSLSGIGPGGVGVISVRALFLNSSPNLFAAKIRGQ
jgi:hypothetical protein